MDTTMTPSVFTDLKALNIILAAVLVVLYPFMWIKYSYINTSTLMGKGMRASSGTLMMCQLHGFMVMAAFSISVEVGESFGYPGIPCSAMLVYCYWACFVNGIAAPLRGLRVLFLFSPKMRVILGPHRAKLKYIVSIYWTYCTVLAIVTLFAYDKYRNGSYCVLWEDWPPFIAFMGGYLPFAVRIKKWIKNEKVQDGYDILRELDGLTVIVNAGGLYMVLRSAIAPRGTHGYRSIGHLSGEYFVYTTCVGAYIYSVIVPLLRHWRVCCYKTKHHLLLGHQPVPTVHPAVIHNATMSGSTPALSTPHGHRFSTPGNGATSPTNGLRSMRNKNGGNGVELTSHSHGGGSTNNSRIAAPRGAWDDHETAMVHSVPTYWQDVSRILRHPLTKNLFMFTAQRFLCPENVRFWLAVDELESITEPLEQLQDIHARVLMIYHDHIRNGSIFEINISSARRLALARQLGINSTSTRVTPTTTPARAKAANAAHQQHLLTVNGATPASTTAGAVAAPPVHTRTASRVLVIGTNGQNQNVSSNKENNSNGDSPVATPRTGSPASPTAAAAGAAVLRPLLAPTPTNNNSTAGVSTIQIGLSTTPLPPPTTLSTPSPINNPTNNLSGINGITSLGLVTVPPSPPAVASGRLSITTAGGGTAGATSYRVHNNTHALTHTMSSNQVTNLYTSTAGSPLTPTNVTIGSVTTTNANAIAIAISGSTVPPTAASIANLQHVYANEKAEVARLMRDNLLPHFLTSPKFQAFLLTADARNVGHGTGGGVRSSVTT